MSQAENKGRYVILVDDDILVLQSLKDQLQSFMDDNILFETCQSAEEAIEVINDILAGGNEVPVVISDYLMGGMTGSEFIVKVQERIPQSRNILLTGQADISGVSKAINAGALYRYISKPWEAADMRLTLAKALQAFDMEMALHRTNDELLTMNRELELKVKSRTLELIETNKALQDGAEYASFVQAHLFPSIQQVKQHLPVTELYLRPYHKISGDFYWMSPKNADGSVYFAAGDCTGHGIAGGFMSVMNIAALNEAMFQSIDRSPEGIMDYVHSRLTEMTTISDELKHVHMRAEMTLLKFRFNESCVDYASNGNGFIAMNRESNEVFFPLRRSISAFTPEGDRTIRKGTLEDVGNMDLVLFTDGITDQFGGSRNRKLGRNGLAQWISDNNGSNAPQSYQSLFEQYSENQVRIDDALIIIFRCV